jgi:hypothetical protein
VLDERHTISCAASCAYPGTRYDSIYAFGTASRLPCGRLHVEEHKFGHRVLCMLSPAQQVC